ncbi:glycosyltransferase family 4 protein [Natronococcus sp. JC468]|uniref:glycosyltransferase n=1 Tax=Natronococcus sp. JC468 TaxID=1961921 RepID=UPI001439FBA4|nr:glycosyltransferase [Natronococcus sp. JC468]NKE34388.1 glycosyltransferase family 4 protein [Natronococcus sp. JC468]
MADTVAAFTDLYRPTVNGVASTVALWRERWGRRRGSMDVVFPETEGYVPESGEYAVPSVEAPLYPRYRLGRPIAPEGVPVPDVVHVHTPFTVGVAGVRFARANGVPVVASYHTILDERVSDRVPDLLVEPGRRLCRAYERAFFARADRVVVPTSFARRHLLESVGADADVAVVSNGIDTDRFRPTDSEPLRDRYGLPDGPLLGYTGRHGPEKRLEEALDAVAGTDHTLVLAGDGPARENLEARAAETNADVRFLGFLEHAELPAFYSVLDAFVFPSPVETQGLVALEATACGTPVVAADAGALVDSVIEGETGYRYEPGDLEAFRRAIRRTLAESDRLSDLCRRRRAMLSVEHSLEQLARVYEDVRR